MNILFVTNRNVYPLIGGIERITYAVAEALRNIYGMHCYSLYTQENVLGQTTEGVFEGKVCLSEKDQVEQIAAYIKGNAINVVIAQGSDARVNQLMPQLKEAANQCHGVKLLFVYHTMPSFELKPIDADVLWHRLVKGKNKSAACKQALIQILTMMLPSVAKKMVAGKYQMPYNNSDKVVLLSDNYIQLYDQFANGEPNHYAVIHNMLSFPMEELSRKDKQKEVILVARLEERAKRVKTALQIWKKACPPDWHLYIVGDGEDMNYYKHFAQTLQLQNVSFEGIQNPLSYYERASIFMMTSAYEGWPMTLMEAQQCGCVPIAFDSYSAVHDIIESGKNGIIVPEGDIDGYARALQALMNNPEELQRLSDNARKDCMRYSRENIAKQWKTLLENL